MGDKNLQKWMNEITSERALSTAADELALRDVLTSIMERQKEPAIEGVDAEDIKKIFDKINEQAGTSIKPPETMPDHAIAMVLSTNFLKGGSYQTPAAKDYTANPDRFVAEEHLAKKRVAKFTQFLERRFEQQLYPQLIHFHSQDPTKSLSLLLLSCHPPRKIKGETDQMAPADHLSPHVFSPEEKRFFAKAVPYLNQFAATLADEIHEKNKGARGR